MAKTRHTKVGTYLKADVEFWVGATLEVEHVDETEHKTGGEDRCRRTTREAAGNSG